MPRRFATPGRKPSTTTSALATSLPTTPAASACLRSSEMLRLLRFSVSNCTGTYERPGSPRGGSTLITSAPRSARIEEANGPGTNIEKSTTWVPASGSHGSDIGRLDPVVECDAAIHHDSAAGDIGAVALRQDGDRHRRDVRRRAEAAQRNLLHHAGRCVEAATRNGTGRDGVDAYAARAERARQLLDEHRLAGLGGAVVRQVARRLRVQRGGEEHAALDAALDHMTPERLAEHECGVEIHRQHSAPLRLGDFEHRLALLAPRARAMHEERHGPQAPDRLFGKLARGLRAREVARQVRFVDVGAEHL